MKVGSLFTGYGGLDTAVGGELAWYAEIDKAACEVLAYRYPGVPNLGDITKIDWTQVEPVDVLTGGYPCQPFSHAGLRKGKNDARHLWPYVRDAIHTLRPEYAVLENVSGHLTLGFANVLSDLATIGFDAEWGTFRASDVGAPHQRKRLFIIAYPDSTRRGEHGGSVTVQQELSAIEYFSNIATDTDSDRHGQQLHSRRMAGVEGQAMGSTQQRERSRRESDSRGVVATADTEHDGWNGRTITRGVGESQDQGRLQQSERRDSDVAADTDMQTGRSTVGGLQTVIVSKDRTRFDSELSRIDWGKYAPAIKRWELTLNRSAPDPVVIRKDKRRLNPKFVEWMMGLPDGWVTGHGLSAAQELKMLGNGVVPQQARAAIAQLMERIPA